jgi:hypothetical protein
MSSGDVGTYCRTELLTLLCHKKMRRGVHRIWALSQFFGKPSLQMKHRGFERRERHLRECKETQQKSKLHFLSRIYRDPLDRTRALHNTNSFFPHFAMSHGHALECSAHI